jgi:hypothetical protein
MIHDTLLRMGWFACRKHLSGPLFTSTVGPSATQHQNDHLIALFRREFNNVALEGKPLPFRQPPSELLLEIFKFALLPTAFMDASLVVVPSSPWCLAHQTKKHMVIVCKSWCQTGTFLLYQDVHLRRIGQVAALFAVHS